MWRREYLFYISLSCCRHPNKKKWPRLGAGGGAIVLVHLFLFCIVWVVIYRQLLALLPIGLVLFPLWNKKGGKPTKQKKKKRESWRDFVRPEMALHRIIQSSGMVIFSIFRCHQFVHFPLLFFFWWGVEVGQTGSRNWANRQNAHHRCSSVGVKKRLTLLHGGSVFNVKQKTPSVYTFNWF